MSVLTAAVYDRMANDATLTALLATYQGEPAIFTIQPVPGDASMPYIVTTGEMSQAPFDTKVERGRRAFRDVRCYATADGTAVTIEEIAERVRTLFHRYSLTVSGFGVVVANVVGPVEADEQDAYGRILTVEFMLMEV